MGVVAIAVGEAGEEDGVVGVAEVVEEHEWPRQNRCMV